MNIVNFFNTPLGRTLGRAAVAFVGVLVQGNAIPLDYAVPGIGVTTGQIITWCLPWLIPSKKA